MRRVTQRLKKAATIAVTPKLWPAACFGVAASVEHVRGLRGLHVRHVIDVGANRGQFATIAASLWPDARIDCFEPLPQCQGILRRVLAAVAPGRSRQHGVAIGEHYGSATLHVATREDSSSLLPLGPRQKAIFAMEEAAQIQIQVAPLSGILRAEDISRPLLLKIDVQGAESAVIKGAREILPYIDYVYVEASFVELYEGQALASDINSLLGEAGFTCESQQNVFVDEGGHAIQADFLYRRHP